MNYNDNKTPLKLREYGRNIQSMVEYALSIEDKDRRGRVAHEIVRIMGNLNPHLKDIPDYKQKLWDHLFMISGYRLDIEAPYNITIPVEDTRKPKRLDYLNQRPRFRQYGWNLELMVQKAIGMEEGPEKRSYINSIANTMKLFLRNLDRESTPESSIALHIQEISRDKLIVDPDQIQLTKAPAPKNHRNNGHHSNGKRNHNKRNNNNRRRKQQ